MNNFKNYLIVILCILFVLASGFGYYNFKAKKEYKSKYEIEQSNVFTLKKGQRDYIIKDSINAVEQYALRLSRDEFKDLYEKTQKEIKYLNNHPKKEIHYVTKFNTVSDTKLRIDTLVVYTKDSCKSYTDGFTTISLCKDSVYVQSVDTITQFISKHYKYKFLWWKWKMDGITQDVYSTNPHNHIIFEEFLQIK